MQPVGHLMQMRSTTGMMTLVLQICFLTAICLCYSAEAYYVDYGEWNSWGFCTAECTQFRRRSCTSKGFLWPCNSRLQFERQSCYTDSCRKPSLLANLSALDCGRRRNPTPVMRIFGGKESQPHSWPWHVSLVNSEFSTDQFCGGTLIHPQFVLTARHCVIGKQNPRSKIFAIVGDHDKRHMQPNKKAYKVLRIRIYHSDRLFRNLEYDVALLMLEKPVTLGDHVRLACLPRPTDRVASSPVKTMCTAIGFGRQSRRVRDPMSPILREVNLYLTDQKQCDLEYEYTSVRINPHSHVCASANGRDTCSGDSGGGLFCSDQPDPSGLERWYLFGITSFGHPRGCGYYSGVFQRASILFDWVQNVIEEQLRKKRLTK